MSAFKFRLSRVLRVRHATEEIQRARLAEAEHEAREREFEATAHADSVRAAHADLADGQSSEQLDPARVLVAIDAAARIERIELDARGRAISARNAAEHERSTWREARADVLGLERLEDRERARFRNERDVREERAIEEVASRRAETARLAASRARKQTSENS